MSRELVRLFWAETVSWVLGTFLFHTLLPYRSLALDAEHCHGCRIALSLPFIPAQEQFLLPIPSHKEGPMNLVNVETSEQGRLNAARESGVPWKKWGPYLSERQWGTVREDYSSNGDAWNYFTHDHAQYRAYRWGEDGLAGISDNRQLLCFALALWNGRDPILKERLFGLSNSEG